MISMLDCLQSKIDKSNAIIAQMLSIAKKPYLSLSFGKDSLVMMDLVRKQRPDIPCLFKCNNETLLLDNYKEMIEAYVSKGVNLTVVNFDRYTLSQYGLNETGKAVDKAFDLAAFFDGWDAIFMGLRIGESPNRRMTLSCKNNNIVGDKIMQYKTGNRKEMYRCCPMAYWQDFEVMLYLDENELPYLSAYNEGYKMRTSTMITANSMKRGMLTRIKKQDFSRYNELVKLMPELRHFNA